MYFGGGVELWRPIYEILHANRRLASFCRLFLRGGEEDTLAPIFLLLAVRDRRLCPTHTDTLQHVLSEHPVSTSSIVSTTAAIIHVTKGRFPLIPGL